MSLLNRPGNFLFSVCQDPAVVLEKMDSPSPEKIGLGHVCVRPITSFKDREVISLSTNCPKSRSVTTTSIKNASDGEILLDETQKAVIIRPSQSLS